MLERRRDTSRGGGPPLSVTVGTNTGIGIRDNQNRRKVTLTNDSDTVIYASKFDQAVLNAGIRLNANGGGFIDEPDPYGYIYTGPWSFISSAANKNLCFIEEM